MALAHQWVDDKGLTLHLDKTHVGNCLLDGQCFEFPGYRFEAGKRWVIKKSLKMLKDKIRNIYHATITQIEKQARKIASGV